MTNGSEGLIYAHLLGAGVEHKNLVWADVEAWEPQMGVLWVHLNADHPGALDWLSQKSGFSQAVQESLLEVGTRPRSLVESHGALIILRGVNFNPGADPDDMVAVRMFINADRVITIQRKRVMAIQDIHEAILNGRGPTTVGAFVVNVADQISDRMGGIISDIEDSVDEMEDNVVTAERAELRPILAVLRRQSIGLKRYIAPQRDMLSRFLHERVDWMSEIDRMHLREVAERTARFVEDIDAARERALIIHEEINSRMAEQMNRAMYTLSIVAAIFMPLGLLTGLLGINVGGIPLAENKWGFMVITLLLIGLALFLVMLFKKIKWL